MRVLDRWQLETAVTARTVGLAYVANRRKEPPLEMFPVGAAQSP